MDKKATTQQIFALCKDKKLEEALQLARPLYAEHANDPQVVKSLGWTLYDCVKAERDAGGLDRARQLLGELQALNITAETDEILHKQLSFISNTLSEEKARINSAKKLSKAGQHAEAAGILRKVVEQYPESEDAKISLGWELYRILSHEANDERAFLLIRQYARLKLNTKPDQLHSLFLTEACKRAESWPNFYAFVAWWNVNNLREEDWRDYCREEGAEPFPSLVVKLAKALYKNAKKFHKRGASNQAILPFMRMVVGKTDHDWTPYYLAKMAVWFEADLSGVKDLVVPLVKAKQTEFWAWQSLADCSIDVVEKTAFYARAVLSPAGNEDYKVDLYHQLALFFAETRQDLLASLSARRYIALRSKKDATLSADIVAMQRAEWFDSQSVDDLNNRLKKPAEDAVLLLFKDHPWTCANFVDVLNSHDGRPPLTVLLLADKGYCKVKKRFVSDYRPAPGTPINVKLFWPPPSTKHLKPGDPPHMPPLAVIVDWEPREAGKPYDLAKKSYGVVSLVNTQKGFVRVSLSAQRFGLLHYDTFPSAKDLALGALLIVWINDTKKEKRIPLLHFEKKERGEVKNLYREFSGAISIKAGSLFGFVQGAADIFVPPDLVLAHKLVDSQQVKGWAIAEWDKKKARAGWGALTIEAV